MLFQKDQKETGEIASHLLTHQFVRFHQYLIYHPTMLIVAQYLQAIKIEHLDQQHL